MNEAGKWIKLHSKILFWEWYKVPNTRDLFIHLLLKANWKEGKFQGYDIPRGSLVAGRKQLAEETGMTEQEIRTALNHLKSTNEITIKTTKKFSIITITNYELYQMNNQVDNQQVTNNQPTANQQLTTIEEYKNIDYISTTSNTHEENLFELIERAFGRTLSSSEYEIINNWQNNELTRYAIKQAELARAFNVKYIQRILENYKKENIKTVTEAEERDRRYQEKKNKKANTIYKQQREVPNWMNETLTSEPMNSAEKEEMEKILEKYKGK